MAFQGNAFQKNAFQQAAGLVPPIAFAFTVTTGQVFATTLNYQTTFYAPPPPAPSNLTTTLEWQPPLSVAVQIPRPAQDGRQPFVPKAATVDNTTNTVWPLAFGEVARPIPYVAQQGHHLFVAKEATSENTTNRVWPLTQGLKANPLPLTAPQGYHLFYPKDATRDNTTVQFWPLTFGEKARPIPAAAQQGSHLFVAKAATVDNTVTPDNWLIRWDLPPRYLLTLPGGQPFVASQPTVANTTTQLWPLAFGEVARPIPYPAPVGFSVYGYPYQSQDNNQTWDKYQQPLSKAVPIPRAAPEGRQPFVPKEATRENTTVRFWPLTFGEIARPQPHWAPQGGSPFVAKAAVLDNTITGIAWLQPFKAPPQYWPAKTQVTYQVEPPVVVVNTITGIPWFQALAVPPRYSPAYSQVTWPAEALAFVDYCAFQFDYFQNPYPLDLTGNFSGFQTCPQAPVPPPPPNKAMSTRFVSSTGFGKDKITAGKSRSSTSGGKGKSKTEHDP